MCVCVCVCGKEPAILSQKYTETGVGHKALVLRKKTIFASVAHECTDAPCCVKLCFVPAINKSVLAHSCLRIFLLLCQRQHNKPFSLNTVDLRQLPLALFFSQPKHEPGPKQVEHLSPKIQKFLKHIDFTMCFCG